MDGAQFAKMLSDKHLFELNRMEYKQTTFIGMARFLLWAVKNPDRDFRQSGFPVL